MNLKEIKDILELIKGSDVSELELVRGDSSLRLRRGAAEDDRADDIGDVEALRRRRRNQIELDDYRRCGAQLCVGREVQHSDQGAATRCAGGGDRHRYRGRAKRTDSVGGKARGRGRQDQVAVSVLLLHERDGLGVSRQRLGIALHHVQIDGERPEITRPVFEKIFPRGRQDGDRKVTLYLSGTNFQLKVWEALRAIPRGTTTTYGALARSLG